MIREKKVYKSKVAVLLEDIQKMKGLFDQYTFSFVNRLGNSYAHNLAKFAVKLVIDVDWEGNFPMRLKESTENDYYVVTLLYLK